MRVKFTRDASILVDGTASVLFRKGAVEELPATSADRWIRRGVAEELVAAPLKSAPKVKPKE